MHRTIESAADHLRRGDVTAEGLLEESLAAIDAHGARTNAFIVVDAAGARAAARAADAERARGVDRGPLHGIPISIKDLIDVAGFPTTAASKVRADHTATEDAPIIRMLRGHGAVLIGKTNLHEFALGTTSEDSAYGPVRNPLDVARSPGGSSGGSAAAVATGMGIASIGSDTGGSIRIPAAACGIVGLKPSYGEISVNGVVPLSKSLDHVGPITRSVMDAAILWGALSDRPPALLSAIDTRAITLGVLGDYFTELLDDQVRSAFDLAIEALRDAGVRIETRAIANASAIMQTYVDISLPEAAHWHAPTLESRAGDYHPNVRARLDVGRKSTAVDYLRSQDARVLYRRAVTLALENCDALALPTLPIVAPPIGGVTADIPGNVGDSALTVRAAMLRLTQLFNLTGHPAISIPVASPGLPVGMQLVGGRDRTEALLRVALACEGVVVG
jgi:aspartyl-tRNA(Asn)/glutamyl-tRNA(Gln) amidotransferase subunit A